MIELEAAIAELQEIPRICKRLLSCGGKGRQNMNFGMCFILEKARSFHLTNSRKNSTFAESLVQEFRFPTKGQWSLEF